MSHADCVSGAKRRAILKLEAGVLEKNGTNEKDGRPFLSGKGNASG